MFRDFAEMATTKQQPPEPALYDRDFYSWALEQARALRDHRMEDLDWENLADEVGDLARSERRAFRSQCARLIEHLLKMAMVPAIMFEHNRRLWTLSLRESRRDVRELLADSPGLKSAIDELFVSAWLAGRDEALKFLEVSDNTIPEAPLWTFEQAIDDSFNPTR